MKAYLIHGWEGYPENCWFPWLKKQLEEKKFKVEVPEMPDTDHPKIEAWVNKLKEIVIPDEETILIGHSIGCQAILRYLENINTKVKAAILVAPWMTLKEGSWEDDEEKEIALPWEETPIDFNKVKQHCSNFTLVYSTNDPCVDETSMFPLKVLNPKEINVGEKGHMSDDDGVTELPEIMKAI